VSIYKKKEKQNGLSNLQKQQLQAAFWRTFHAKAVDPAG
jgi:hypothetical protein